MTKRRSVEHGGGLRVLFAVLVCIVIRGATKHSYPILRTLDHRKFGVFLVLRRRSLEHHEVPIVFLSAFSDVLVELLVLIA